MSDYSLDKAFKLLDYHMSVDNTKGQVFVDNLRVLIEKDNRLSDVKLMANYNCASDENEIELSIKFSHDKVRRLEGLKREQSRIEDELKEFGEAV